jgi:hypothetical protein
MAKRAKQRAKLKDEKSKKAIFLVSCIILAVKLVLILSVKNGGWLGADGESYLKGVDALIKSGLSSKESVLVYWPAGYPILLWILSLVSVAKLIYLLSFFQTILYFAASAFFVERLRQTRLSKLALPVALILGLNPTLSLSSLAIGYESLVASCMLASVALIIRYEQQQKNWSNLIQTLLCVGIIQSFSAFMQPRGLVMGFFIFIFWGIFHRSWKHFMTIVVLGICAMMILPAGLVMRNASAGNGAVISRNLGITMSLGAGDKASGGYGNTGGVPCSPTPPATTASDNQLVKCTISWYLKNPGKTAILTLKKSLYFWSPWYGPLANGTMARNPWLKVDPIKNIDTTRQGHNLVYGWVGKVISWAWLLAGLIFLFFGFGWLWKLQGLERQISVLAGIPVLLAWLTSVGTIGDHRFRLPTMGLSLFLQVAGYFGLRDRFSRSPRRATLEPRGRAR